MSDNKFIVYMATNIANGKRYVGFTSVGIDKRKKAHFSKAFSKENGCPKFHAAIRKYGRDAFSWQILATFDSKQEALDEEISFIKEISPEYNLSSGGDRGNLGLPAWNRRQVTCLEDGKTFDSADAANKFYSLSSNAVSEVCRGKNRSSNGLHFVWGHYYGSHKERTDLIKSIEMVHAKRRKRVDKNQNHPELMDGKDAKGRTAAGPIKNSRSVICLDDYREFPSISSASRFYNVDKGAIVRLCQGKDGRISVGGLKFKYKEKI